MTRENFSRVWAFCGVRQYTCRVDAMGTGCRITAQSAVWGGMAEACVIDRGVDAALAKRTIGGDGH